ncbi:hypothetical protein ACFFSH_19145 [Streptomyces filamentosus]|uniref:Lipoprotein n=1 Tax=Streptomyces filamentosus TaxID=67294 RepID=A0A919BJA6_STRFL|nr:hypothetical protein [Streptomyces filamentosus]GHF91356.1 hypothetical protein GCM10017667_20800 [Streptomyces filamentosus]
MRLRRALLIASAIPALFLTTACSGGPADSEGKKPEPSRKSTQSAQEKESAEAKRLGTLDTPALEEVVLTGTVAGMEAKKIAKAEVEAGRDMDADRKECRPLASMIGGFTHITPVATAHRSLQSAKATEATVGSMWLASHSEQNATRVMDELGAAVTACPKGFKTLGLTYGKVEKLPAPELGAQAVAYRITGDIGKQKVPMTYTVVREGGVIAAFYGVNMLDPENAAIPEAVVKAQLDRL